MVSFHTIMQFLALFLSFGVEVESNSQASNCNFWTSNWSNESNKDCGWDNKSLYYDKTKF